MIWLALEARISVSLSQWHLNFSSSGAGLVRHFGTGENIVLHCQFFGKKANDALKNIFLDVFSRFPSFSIVFLCSQLPGRTSSPSASAVSLLGMRKEGREDPMRSVGAVNPRKSMSFEPR